MVYTPLQKKQHLLVGQPFANGVIHPIPQVGRQAKTSLALEMGFLWTSVSVHQFCTLLVLKVGLL